jgi:hypothetical protein
MKGEAVALDDLLPVGAGSKGDALHGFSLPKSGIAL